ncbi:hypothetical protein N9X23_01225 [Flavobacteriales bacterium]|nr:hypothetical protein [Flavobacteriales bacterium]
MINKYLVLILCFFLFIGFDFLYVNFLVIQEIKKADIFIVNSFLLALTFSFFFLYNILKKRSKTSPFTYLTLSFFKMIASLVFLYPLISQKDINFLPYILHFFFFYFAYLFVEIFLLMKGSE